METQELVLTPPPIAQPDPTLALIERAVLSPDFDVDKLGKILDMRKEMVADHAKAEFDVAKAKFSAFAVTVTKDKTNKQYDSKYTSIGNLVNTVTPFLGQCELNARWEIDQTGGIKVTCILSHAAGHSERVSLTVPPDTSGQKNPLQQIKSAITYAKICTFESVCGLASTDANVDDDGNSSSSNGELTERIEFLKNCCTKAELGSLFKTYYAEYPNKRDKLALLDAYEVRKAELNKEGR